MDAHVAGADVEVDRAGPDIGDVGDEIAAEAGPANRMSATMPAVAAVTPVAAAPFSIVRRVVVFARTANSVGVTGVSSIGIAVSRR